MIEHQISRSNDTGNLICTRCGLFTKNPRIFAEQSCESRRPAGEATEPITETRAGVVAAHCPGCEDPSMYASRGCPGLRPEEEPAAWTENHHEAQRWLAERFGHGIANVDSLADLLRLVRTDAIAELEADAVAYRAALTETEALSGRVRALEAVIKDTDHLRQKLVQLHTIAFRHLPVKPSPERIAEFRAKHDATVARIGPEQALRNVLRGLRPQVASDERIAEIEAAWAAWNSETDLQAKCELQRRLGEFVAGLLETVEALREPEQETEEEHPDAERVLKLLIQRVGGNATMTRADLRRANGYQLRWTDNGHTIQVLAVRDT